MLLPDNIHPELSLYYNGALVISELRRKNCQKIIDIFHNINLIHEISFPTLVLCLDWLYLIDVAVVNTNGDVELCS